MFFRQIYDPYLAQNAYLVGCQKTREAVLIDPERDVDRYFEHAAEEGLEITGVAETHIHADYLSGAREMAERHGVRLYLSDEGGDDWKYEWARHGGYDFQPLKHGDAFRIGHVELRALHTAGHTPEHLSFLITDRGGGADEPMGLLSGDFVFVGDVGRPDLLETAAGYLGAREPSARQLFHSLRGFLELPDFLQLWPAHGAGSACGKALGAVPMSTVGYEKRFNTAIAAAKRGEQVFVDAILEGQPEPPLYFGRMKRLNKTGPDVLGELPAPRPLDVSEVDAVLADPGAVVLDLRPDRCEFMRGHLPGSLYAPFGKSFTAVAGSYVLPEESIFLIADDDEVEAAVRALVRIGLDRVAGSWTPDVLREYRGGLRHTEVIDFREVERRHGEPGTRVLDVRGAAEYGVGHLPGALNVAHTRLLDRLAEIPRDGRLLVHCQSGARASYASALLERAGRDVSYVDDVFVA